MEKKQKEMEAAVNNLLKEREKDKDDFNKREKELMKKIAELTSEGLHLKDRVKDLESETLAKD